jgi:hypothetical protein
MYYRVNLFSLSCSRLGVGAVVTARREAQLGRAYRAFEASPGEGAPS